MTEVIEVWIAKSRVFVQEDACKRHCIVVIRLTSIGGRRNMWPLVEKSTGTYQCMLEHQPQPNHTDMTHIHCMASVVMLLQALTQQMTHAYSWDVINDNMGVMIVYDWQRGQSPASMLHDLQPWLSFHLCSNGSQAINKLKIAVLHTGREKKNLKSVN